jgi:hypothetical protein
LLKTVDDAANMRSSIMRKIQDANIQKHSLIREYTKNREAMLDTILSAMKPGFDFEQANKNTLSSDQHKKMVLEEGLVHLRKQALIVSDEVREVVNPPKNAMGEKINLVQKWCAKSIDLHGIYITYFFN